MNILQARQRRALATIITSAIMMSSVALMGSAGIVWSQSSLTAKQVDMTDTAVNYMNKLNESLVFEYVYCATDPCEQINVVLTNVGHVGLEVSKVTISDKISGFSKIHPVLNGQIMPDHSILIPISDAGFSSYNILDVMVETHRGNIIQTQTNT